MPADFFTLALILSAVWLLGRLPLPPQVNVVVVVIALILVGWLALRHFGGVG